MAFTEVLRLVIDADTRGAVQGIKSLGDTADRELGRSEKSLDRWGSRLTSVGAGMIAFGGAALVGLGALAKESEQANLAQVKLQNTINNMPKLAGATAKEFTDLADSIQDVTAADADAIVEAEALLGTFNLTADEIKSITPLVVDYARKFGVGLTDAAVQVGKALDGNIGALKRNGVSIDEVAFATDRYAAVQRALSDQVGGFAEAEGKTFAGSLERMKNELGDLAEGVGGGAVDAFTSLFSVVERGANALEGISPGAQNAIGKFATFGAVGLVAAGGINVLVGTLITFRSSVGSVIDGVSGLTQKMGGLKTVLGVGGVVTAIAAVSLGIEEFNNRQQQMNIDRMTDEFLAAGKSVDGMQAAVETLIDQGFSELLGTFERLNETNHEAAERFIEQAEAAGVASEIIEQMRHNLDTTAAAQEQMATDTDTAAGSLDDAATAAQSYSDKLTALFDPLQGAINAQRQLREANAAVTEAELTLAGAIVEHGEGSLQAQAATDALVDAQNRAVDAAINQAGSLDDLRRGLQDGSIQIDEARRRLDEFVDAGLVSASTAAAFRAELDKLDGRVVNVSIVTRQTTILEGSRNIPLRQHGGPVAAGQAYIVGEERPELFVPDRNGMIMASVPGTSATHTSFGGGGGGGGTVMLKFDSSSNPIDQLFMEILRRNVRLQHGGNVQAAIGFNR